MADLIERKVQLTPVYGNVMEQGARELFDVREAVEGAMHALQPLIKRINTNREHNQPHDNEAGRAAAVALTKLEEALMWAERAYLWEGKV